MKDRILRQVAILLFVSFCVTNIFAVVVTTVFHSASSVPSNVPFGVTTIQVNWLDSFLSSVDATENFGENGITELRKTEKQIIDFPDIFPTLSLSNHVTEAILYMYNVGADTVGTDISWTGKLVNASWAENTVTWNSHESSVAAFPEETGTITCNSEGYNALDITALIKGYKAEQSSCYGIMLSGGGNGGLFISEDNGTDEDTSQQPYLLVISEIDEVVLIAPEDKTDFNVFSINFDVYYSPKVVYPYLLTSTNGVDWVDHYNVTNILFPSEGTYKWTAYGVDETTDISYYARTTNELTITLPTVSLISPADDTTLINQFSVDLVAQYGNSTIRQLSTNNGTHWFDYNPGELVRFNTTGEWHWLARGGGDLVSMVETETRKLTILAEYSGAGAIFLNAPLSGAITTNPSPEFSVITFGGPFTQTQLGVDALPLFNLIFPSSENVGVGVHTWRAKAFQASGSLHYYSPTTNTFEVLASESAAVRLLSPITGNTRKEGYVSLDVRFINVTGGEISIDNGETWFAYSNPFNIINGTYNWTARGTNASGSYVYANSTNLLTIATTMSGIFITNSNETVTWEVKNYTIGGTNSETVTGTMNWENSLGGTGTLSAASAWEISEIPLSVGNNVITVSGSNGGDLVNDNVTITRGGAGMGTPHLNVTNTVVNVSSNLYTLAGTNNLHVVGVIGCSNAQNETTINATRTGGDTAWKGLLALEDGDNYLYAYGTNSLGEVTDDYIVINYNDGSGPEFIENFRIALSNDYMRTILTWSNAVESVNILAQTNKYYNLEGPWFLLAEDVDSGYVHEDASNYWSCYYKVIRGNSTGRYEVGKMDAKLPGGEDKIQCWVSSPFIHFDDCLTVQEIFMEQLFASFPSSLTDKVESQQKIGDINNIGTIYWMLRNNVPAWLTSKPWSAIWTHVKMYKVTRAANAPDTFVTFRGMVPTNDIEVIVNRDNLNGRHANWVGSLYPSPYFIQDSTMTNVLRASFPSSSTDKVESQEKIGDINNIGTVYWILRNTVPTWLTSKPWTTDMVPCKGYSIMFDPLSLSAGGETNWFCPKPY